MVRRRIGDEQLIALYKDSVTHICVTRPQWVKSGLYFNIRDTNLAMSENAICWLIAVLSELIGRHLVDIIDKTRNAGADWISARRWLLLMFWHPIGVSQNVCYSRFPVPVQTFNKWYLKISSTVYQIRDRLAGPGLAFQVNGHCFLSKWPTSSQFGEKGSTHLGDHYRDYNPGALSLSQVTATHMKIRHP